MIKTHKRNNLQKKNLLFNKTKKKSLNTGNIQIITKIGEGWAGAVYKCKIGANLFGIYKIEKNNDFNDGYKSNYVRQIDFSNNLGNNYPDRFLTLEQSGIIFNCNYTSHIPQGMPKYLQKEKLKSNQIKSCSYLIYTPILDGTLRQILPNLSLIEFKKMVNYVFDTIDIIHSNGYLHRDIHDENIMYKKVSGKYIWFIIDYGLIYHTKYTQNNTDILVFQKNWQNDKLAFIYSILKKPILDIIEQQNMWSDINNFEDRIKYIKQASDFDNIKKYIPSNLTLKEIDEVIIIITIILNNKLFIESLGLDYEQYKKYDISQIDNKFILGLLKKI